MCRWHSPCQPTPLGCNLLSMMLRNFGAQNQVVTPSRYLASAGTPVMITIIMSLSVWKAWSWLCCCTPCRGEGLWHDTWLVSSQTTELLAAKHDHWKQCHKNTATDGRDTQTLKHKAEIVHYFETSHCFNRFMKPVGVDTQALIFRTWLPCLPECF